MIAEDDTISKFPGKFPGCTPSNEAPEKGPNYEFLSYVVSDSDSEFESTTRSKPKCNELEDSCESRQLQNILPQIVTQLTNNVNNTNANGSGGNGNGGNNECTYKGFMACNPKEYDEKGGAIALTRWIGKMESVIENSGCSENQKVKYAASSFINKALTWWNTQVQERGREAAIGISWADFKTLLVEEFCPSNEIKKLENEFWNHKMVGANHAAYIGRFHELAKLVSHLVTPKSSCIKRARILTDEVVSDGTLMKGNEKIKGVEETSKPGGSWKDNKKEKVGTGFVATAPPRNEFDNQSVCYECGSSDHLRNTYPKMQRAPGQAVNPLALEGNRNTQNNRNLVRGKAFNINAVDALQDPNVVTGTFSLNNHFATVLFGFGADFSFISTNFVPLLNVKPSIVNPGYVVEVADGKKVEVDRIIRDCKLELVNSLFIIDLILLGHESFDVIVGIDWLTKNKAVIVCYEKVVEISLKGGGILQVQGEHTLGVAKALMNTKVDEPKLSDILVVQDFVDVFSKDLSGLPPQRQVKFRTDLAPRATPVAKSLYHLAPSEMQELSGQLQEKLNKLTVKNRYPLLRIDDLFDQLQGARHFSKIDLRWVITSSEYMKMIFQRPIFMDLMNWDCKPYLDKFVIVFIDDILIYSKSKDEYEVYLRLVLELLKNEKLYVKYSKCEFWLQEVHFLGHVVNQDGIHVDLSKANVVADALSRKEQVKPRHVRAMAITIQPGIRGMILAAQRESFKQDNVLTERLHGLDQQMERKEDENLYFMDRIWVPLVRGVRMIIMDEAYKTRSPVLWDDIGESSLIDPELVQETTDKVVSPWKGMICFGNKGKLALRYVGPFEILERIGPVAYRLRLPEELSSVYDTFYVSNLKKCLEDSSFHVPLDEIKIDKTLRFVEEPIEIRDREVRSLKNNKISLVKVRWNSRCGPEFTWEREDHMRSKYPQLFVNRAVEPAS
uniref:Reverse transcriptase domain-containing protein n=1 Tax=Tanacetum cinerariifolium TaxID=118510 RepID=A0A6L2M064_TANCI|nr:hypothetical protein [Tanacetum cinerariifolium]